MHKKSIVFILILIMLFSVIVPTSISADESSWWNNSWSSRKEIEIPINTSSIEAKFQPIDISIEFNDSCWAKNENEHSIRVIFQDGSRFIELESQIYDLKFKDSEHLSSCSLVFLIPQEANGNEKYFIYYDDETKSSTNYADRVDIGEAYYQYGPIFGLSFESFFYKITQDGEIVYAVNKKGTAWGDTTSQQVTKLKKGSKDIKPSNGEQITSLAFIYWWYVNGKWLFTSSAQTFVSSQIFVDGNLMVKFAIVSKSGDGRLKSTVVYKYYYCPTENKRMYTHIKHEVTKYPLPSGEEIDVGLTIIHCGGIRSSTIEELNFGEIPPYLHMYSEEDRILTYKMNQYPEGKEWQELISKNDDYDLGNHSWLSVDEGETGKAQGMIFGSNKVVKSGEDERDGISIQLYESNNIQLPGLDGRFAYVYILRNAYEKGIGRDDTLANNYIAEFNADLFSTKDGGYPAVEKEAGIYQALVGYQPEFEGDIENGKEIEQYELIAYGHLPISLTMKLWSLRLLLQKPYISAELISENQESVGNGRLDRIPVTEDIHIDWKNVSLFRKIKFPNLPAGRYVLKIYLENTLLADKRDFIGYQIVDLKQNTTLHIFCKPEGKIKVLLHDQEGSGIENAEVYILKNDTIIEKNLSDANGQVLIGAPSGLKEKYTLRVMYKGFLISEEEIRLGLIRRFLPLGKNYNFSVYDLVINFKDSKGETPDFNVDLSLTSPEMKNPIVLAPDDFTDGIYHFNNLYPANYGLLIKFNQFEIKEMIQIPKTNTISIDLYDFSVIIKDSWNLSPEALLDVTLTSKGFEKETVLTAKKLSSEEYLFSNLYPGNYTFKVSYKDHTLEEKISIPYKQGNNKTIVFPAEFNTTIKVFDIRGNSIKDAKVFMARGDEKNRKEVSGSTNEDGVILFSVPPGTYDCKIYSGEVLIGKRKIEVLSENSQDIATKSEPLIPFIIIGLAIVMIIGALYISYRKKDLKFFLKILAAGIAIIAILSPLWAINGSTQGKIETSTNLFLIPANMVTISSNVNATAGEISTLNDLFISVTDLLAIIVLIGVVCIPISMVLKKYNKRRISFVVLLISLIMFIGSTITFYYATSQLADLTVGSFAGSGNLDVLIPGEKMYVTIPCSWGPSAGFYLLLISTVTIVCIFCFDFVKMLLKRVKK